MKRLAISAVAAWRQAHPGGVILDARRGSANAEGLPGAVRLRLDEDPLQLPQLPPATPILVYCLCRGQTSSTRIALLLEAMGQQQIMVLDGGLPAWLEAGQPVVAVQETPVAWVWRPAPPALPAERPIAEQAWQIDPARPQRREMAVLFVDMVDSTGLVLSRTPEEVLALLQVFMAIVVEVAAAHCGDVHDFEGDGALLYFAGSGEALPAAFAIRAALSARREQLPALPLARIALAEGHLVVGWIGGSARRGLAFVGPCINTAARLLAVAEPGGIVASADFVAAATLLDPDHAARFDALAEPVHLKGFNAPVKVMQAPWAPVEEER